MSSSATESALKPVPLVHTLLSRRPASLVVMVTTGMAVDVSSSVQLVKPSMSSETFASAQSEPAGLAPSVLTALLVESTILTPNSVTVLLELDGTVIPALRLTPAQEAKNGMSTLSPATAQLAQAGTELSALEEECAQEDPTSTPRPTNVCAQMATS